MKRYISILKSLILAAAILAAASCTRDSVIPTPENPSGDEMRIHFRASAPGPKTAGTRAADDPEWAVNKITVLVFEQTVEDGDYLFQYKVDGRNIEQETNANAYFEAFLVPNENPVRLLFVANYPAGALGAIGNGATEAEVRAAMKSSDLDFSTSGLPMTGVAEQDALDANTGVIRFPLMRSVAKATVAVDLRENSLDFTLTSVAVYHSNDTWWLFPDPASVQDETTSPMPIAPTVPGGDPMTTEVTVDDASQFYSGYLAENVANADPTTCIVVGGIFDEDENPSYYRIDFGEDEDIGQVLRNFWYRFTIVGVTDPGYATADLAAESASEGILTTVLPWDGGENTDYYFGSGDYVRLSEESILLDVVQDHTATFTITTSDVPFTITAGSDPLAGSLDTANPSQTLETAGMSFAMTPVSGAPESEQMWEISVTATAGFDASADDLLLHAGDGLMTIHIPVYSLERISAAETVPHTGTPDETTGTYTHYVEYRVNIPAGGSATWNAEITGQSWVSGKEDFAPHEGYLLGADGQPDPDGTVTGIGGPQTLRVGFDRLYYYPIVGESPQVQVAISVDGRPEKAKTIAVAQSPLQFVGTLGVLDMNTGNTDHSLMDAGNIATFANYLKSPLMFGPADGVVVYAPNVLAPTAAPDNPSSDILDYHYLFAGGNVANWSGANNKWTALNTFWGTYRNERIIVFMGDVASTTAGNNIFSGGTITTPLTTLGIVYKKPPQYASWSFNPAITNTALYRYLVQDGPFGPVENPEAMKYSVDQYAWGADVSTLPTTAIPLFVDPNGASGFFVDPANGLVYIDEAGFLSWGDTPQNVVNKAATVSSHDYFLANLIAYTVNCAQYGSSFANLFIPGNEALYDAAFPTTPNP